MFMKNNRKFHKPFVFKYIILYLILLNQLFEYNENNIQDVIDKFH